MEQETRPLADRIRPTTLDEFIGQDHLVGPSKPIRLMIEQKRLSSMILWGPPGVGKTTLARLIAAQAGRRCFELSAVSAGKDDMRRIVDQAKTSGSLFDQGGKPVLFLDEIHRFNKAQQDFLLPHVEQGTMTLIGATTENPSFEVISALLSRTRVLVLKAHTEDDLRKILARGLEELGAEADEEALSFLAKFSGGDARQALNLLQDAAELSGGTVTGAMLESSLQTRALRYDKGGDEHYNIASAFIKSMRAGSADAALYYLARMVDAGEDPKFIARRMLIFASEDVGLATPTALLVAEAAFRSAEVIGYPECALNLAHAAAFLARAPKSRHTTEALGKALEDVRRHGALPVPIKLRNAPTQLMKDEGYGEGYEKYDASGLLPDELEGQVYLDLPPKTAKD